MAPPRNKRGTRRPRRNARVANPATKQLTYRGPVETRKERYDQDLTIMVLSDFTPISSTAGGIIADVYSSLPSVSASWADCTAVWSEYRVLAHEIQYLPMNQYSKTTTVCVPGVGVLDRRSSTPLASLAASEGFASARRLSLENPWTMKINMDNIDEASFIDVGGPVAFNWIKLFFTGLSVSTAYGQVLHRFRIQFRNPA